MRKKILPILILLRIMMNDGFFMENRRNQPKPQPPEVRAAIRRTWKRGIKKLSNSNPSS